MVNTAHTQTIQPHLRQALPPQTMDLMELMEHTTLTNVKRKLLLLQSPLPPLKLPLNQRQRQHLQTVSILYPLLGSTKHPILISEKMEITETTVNMAHTRTTLLRPHPPPITVPMHPMVPTSALRKLHLLIVSTHSMLPTRIVLISLDGDYGNYGAYGTYKDYPAPPPTYASYGSYKRAILKALGFH